MMAALTVMIGAQLAAPGAGAQALAPGDRVRLTLGSGKSYPMIGELVEVVGDTIVLNRENTTSGPTRVVAVQVQSIERSVGLRTQGTRGATIGALVGGTLGAVLGYAAGGDLAPPCAPADYMCKLFIEPYDKLGDREHTTVLGAAIGAMAGVTIGGIIGLTSTTDKWQVLTAPDHPVKLEVAPAGAAGARATLSYAFGAARRK